MFNLTKSHEERARELHYGSIVVDGHCDSIGDVIKGKRSLAKMSDIGHLDVPRMIEGGVNVQIFALWIESEYKPDRSLKRGLKLLSYLLKEMDRAKESLEVPKDLSSIESLVNQGKSVGLISFEGGEILQREIEILYILKNLGVHSICLTWNERNEIADGVGELHSGGGLTNFGREVVKEMNKLSMIIDVSHITPKGFWDVIGETKKPIIASHSNAYRLMNHPRNLTDEQLMAIAQNKGLVGVNFAPEFIHGKQSAVELVEHIEHIANVAGIDHVGLGSDFDGITETPEGLENATKMINITRGLVYKGFSDLEIKKVLGLNFLRVFKEIEK
jgi:membrane dipeptidase